MKNLLITLIALALCAHAQAQDRTLSTTDGVTYTGITHQRVEPDGLYIEYSLPGGGIGMSKVKFSRLSHAQQKQFGYDRTDARDYEAAVAQANEDMAQDLIHRSQVERDARRQRDADNQRAYPGRMAQIASVNAARCAAFHKAHTSDWRPNSGLSYGAEFTAGRTSIETSHAIGSGGDPFPNRGVTVRSH